MVGPEDIHKYANITSLTSGKASCILLMEYYYLERLGTEWMLIAIGWNAQPWYIRFLPKGGRGEGR